MIRICSDAHMCQMQWISDIRWGWDMQGLRWPQAERGQKHTQNSLTFNVKQNNAETQNIRGLLVQLPWIWGEIIYWKLFI